MVYFECLDNCLLVFIMSKVLIWGILTIVVLSPSCHGYSFGVSCQSSICLHYVTCIHKGCLDKCLFVSIISWLLILIVFTIVSLSPCCHGYSLEVSYQWLYVSIMSWVLYWSPMTIFFLFPLCHGYTSGVSRKLSICLNYVRGTLWKCLDNCLLVSIMSWVLIGVS